MPFDGNGVYSPPGLPAFPPNTGDIISAPYYIQVIQDIAAALSKAFLRDGSVAFTADFDIGNHALKGLMQGTAAVPAIRFQDDSDTGLFLDGAGRLALAVDGIKVMTLTKDSLFYAKAVSVNIPYAAIITPDLALGFNFDVTQTGDITLANPANINQAIGTSGVFEFVQDATGGRSIALGSVYRVAGNFNIDKGANKTNLVSYYVRSAAKVYLSLIPGY